jgi:hypothetical protein
MDNKFINAMRQKDSYTENGALTNSTTLNSVLDLFFKAGASRNLSEQDIINMLVKSWEEDKLLTLKLIFWAGDIRKGAGERRFFRIALDWLNRNHTEVLASNVLNVPFYNRYDSLFNLADGMLEDFVLNHIKEQLDKGNALVAKWMPRKTQLNNFASTFRKYFKLTPKQYRKLITKFNNVVETKMCNKEWDKIEYSKVPSVAFSRHKKSFSRNDEVRFGEFLSNVKKGKEKVNAGAIFPHDVIKDVYENHLSDNNWYDGEVELSQTDKDAVEVQWNALPNYLEGTGEKILPVCDVSGSMEGLPILISIALGLYLSERNTSEFKDAIITFSEHPQLEYLKGNVIERIQQLSDVDWGMSTNFQAVFDMILTKAKENKLDQSDMPTKVLVISDMEFNEAENGNTNFDEIKRKYEEAGYTLPQLVFWNVDSRKVKNFPVSFNEKNVGLISGASPSIIKSILGGDIDPMKIMLNTLNNERYDKVILDK